MAAGDKNLDPVKYQSQEIDNREHDVDSQSKRVVVTRDISETEQPLITRVDEASVASVTFVGEAAPNSASSEAVWRIQKIDETGEETVITYADGNSLFDNIWDNRTTLEYA